MAILVGPDGRQVTLVARTLVGRSPGCGLQLDDRRVSGEQAVLSWGAEGWSARDLGSRNGTWVDGVRLEVGVKAPLAQGSQIAFGDERRTWRLDEASSPNAQARRLSDGTVRTAEDEAGDGGLLALPDPDQLDMTIYRLPEGTWVLEDDTGTRRVAHDLETVTVLGEAWQLHLPGTLPPTVCSVEVGQLALEFRVSPDEEHVEIVARGEWGEQSLRARSHHYLLLTLARERLADEQAGRPPSEQGWVREEALADMLRLDRQTIRVQIYRARRQVARHGWAGAAGIVERRPGTGQLRLGVTQVRVHSER